MHKLNDTSQTPYCGWIYVVPETKTPLEANSFTGLVDKAMENYRINEIEIDRKIVDAQIQDYLCTRIPSGLCKGFLNKYVLSPKQLFDGTSALFAASIGGKAVFVPRTHAEKRASICAECKANCKINGCTQDHGIPGFIKSRKGNRETSFDKELNVCVICKCFIELMVHLSPVIYEKLVKAKHLHRYPKHCWKRREIEQLRRQP